MTRVLVDGVIYAMQDFGGISRWFTETLARVGLYTDDMRVTLHLPENCRAETPRAKWIHEIRDWRPPPRRLFRGIYRPVSRARAWAMRPGVFHSSYYTSPYWPGMKVVVTVYDFIHERFPELLSDADSLIPQKRRVIESADAVVAISHSTKDDILTYTDADESKIVVIHPGVSDTLLGHFSSKVDGDCLCANGELGNPYWLHVGSRTLYKNFETLLRAFLRVAPQTGGYLLAVGGNSELESWQDDLLKGSHLEHRVRLCSAAHDRCLAPAYSGAAAFVFPSLVEGFGLPILEAMACGAPVICSDIAVFREVAADAALYFDPCDDEALADAMTRVLDGSVRQGMVERGLGRAREFSWDTAARKLVGVYNSLS
jgi:glycosyltransferase involved in cell wall biosynthesis